MTESLVSQPDGSRLGRAISSASSFCLEVAQWRHPSVSSLYLLLVNAGYWACVFYLTAKQQLIILQSVVVLCSAYMLLPLSASDKANWKQSLERKNFLSEISRTKKCGRTIQKAKHCQSYIKNITNAVPVAYKRWFDREDKDRRSAAVLTLWAVVGIIGFPAELLILSLGKFIIVTLFVENFLPVLLILSFTTSSCYLYLDNHDRAYWLTYMTMIIVLITPTWRFNQVTEQFTSKISAFGCGIYAWLTNYILSPCYNAAVASVEFFRYWLCGYWIKPLMESILATGSSIWSFVRRNFVQPIANFIDIWRQRIVYVFGGYWIPPLLAYLNEQKERFYDWCDRRIVQPVKRAYDRFCGFLIYWFCGHWIPPLCQFCVRQKDNLIMAIQRYLVDPVVAFFSDFKLNMQYILFGYWIPPFISWIRTRVVEPTQKAVVKCIYGIDYIMRGKWIPGMIEYMKRKRIELSEYLKECAVRLVVYVRDRWVRPSILWLKDARTRFRYWLINSVLKPTWRETKRLLHRSKLYVKHRILYPALRRALYYTCVGILYCWENVITPAFAYLQIKGGVWKDFAWINYGKPVSNWLAKNMPEKSPFVDDSDTELRDFLPSDEEDDEIRNKELELEDESPEVLSAPVTTLLSTIDNVLVTPAPIGLPGSRSSSCSSDDDVSDDEFSIGLSNFPSVENADSDEEEEKSMIPRKGSKASSSSSKPTPKVIRIKTRTRKSLKEILPDESSSSDELETANSSSIAKQITHTRPKTKASDENKTTKPPLHEPDFEMIDHMDVDI